MQTVETALSLQAEKGAGFVALAVILALFVLISLWLGKWLVPKLLDVISNNTEALSNNTKTMESAQVQQVQAFALLQQINDKVATREDMKTIHTRLDEQCAGINNLVGRANSGGC